MASRQSTAKSKTPTKQTPAPPAAMVPYAADMADTRDGLGVLANFGMNLEAFFERAEHLTRRADETLLEARGVAAPTTAGEDEQIQIKAKRGNEDLRETRAHYDTITKVLTRLHRYFTGKRTRTEQPTEEAVKILNRLHNGWTDAERRRVAQENERRRLQAEQDAAAERQRDLDRLEAQALEREARMEELSEREQKYVQLVCTGTEPTAAAKMCGYKDAFGTAARLQGTEKIRQAILAKREALALREAASTVAQQPVDVDFEEATANVTRAAGVKERTTWKGVVDDERAFVDAVIAGTYGIPRELLIIDRVLLNDKARGLKKLMDKWPGVHAESSTGLV